MGREIEIKIPLTEAQYNKIYSVISGNEKLDGIEVDSSELEHIVKNDTYFSRYNSREESKAAGEPQVIRIRSEKLLSAEADAMSDECPNGQIKKQAFFCIKRKSIENGIELNREDETYVENPEVVRDLLLLSGYHQFFEKNKDSFGVYCRSRLLEGSAFHLELEKVNALKYLEVEVTDEANSADAVRAALEKFVKLFGLDAAKRDSRSWMEILQGGLN